MHALTSSPATGPPPGTLRCTRHDVADGVVRLALRGELDMSSGPELARALAETSADGTFVVVDADELEFVDPAGAAALRDAGHSAGSNIVAVNLQPHVRTTLMTIGVHRVLKLVDTTPAALVDDQAA